jgi:hypothetical protein
MTHHPASAAGAEPDLEVEVGAPPLAAPAAGTLAVDPDDSRYADSAVFSFGPAVLGATGTDWRFRFREAGAAFADFDPEFLEDAYLVVGYSIHAMA